jgi:hypothetical protein
MGGVYYMLQDSVGFDNLMHGKSPKGNQKQRSLEDFGMLSFSIVPHIARAAANNVLQLSPSSVSRLSTRSRNKCGVFGVVGDMEQKAPRGVGRSFDFFLKLFHVHYFVTWLYGGDVDSHTL